MQHEDLIGYDQIIEGAMRSVIYETLKKVEKSGLPGNHYFIITFATKFPDVSLPKSLLEKYHEEMTIVLQHQYRKLVVEDDKFQISLSFSGKYEKLSIPYKAITSFSDPSIRFALKFSINYDDLAKIEATEDELPLANKDSRNKKIADEIDLSAKVISLDAFRKNKNNKKDS